MMHHFLETTAHYMQAHPRVGVLFAFFIAFLESLPIIGIIIPGSIVMTAVGAMIGAGWLPAYITLSVAAFGALLGDLVGFAIGYIFKDKLRDMWPFKQHPKIITYSTDFIARHGGKSILIGRFVGPARSAVPMAAGLLHLPWYRFLLAVIPTAILWTLAYTVPGIIFGAFSLKIEPRLLTKYLISGAVIISLLWLSYWFIQRSFNTINTYYHQKMALYWRFFQRYPKNPFIHYICNQQNRSCYLQFNRCFWLILCLVILFCLVCTGLFEWHATYVNVLLFNFMQSLRLHPLDSFFTIITILGAPNATLCIGVGLSGFLALTKQWRASVHFLVAIFLSILAIFIMKHMWFNPRPSGFMLVAPTSSFPSGHTTISLVIYGFIAFLAGQYFTKHRSLIYTIAGIFIGLVGISRLYLGAHWFLDVIAAVFLGFTVLLLVIISYQRLPKSTSSLQLHPRYWLPVSGLWMIVVWSFAVYHDYAKVLYSTTPFQEHTRVSLKDWWKNPLDYVPLYRNNRFGYPIQPLNIEWAGNLKQIKQLLLTYQWQLIAQNDQVKDTIQRLSSSAPQYHLPVFELLYRNERPALTLYKPSANKSAIYILRLWHSHITLDSHKTLWLGMLGLYQKTLSFPETDIPSILFNHPNPPITSRMIWEDPSGNTHLKAYWDGRVWLLFQN